MLIQYQDDRVLVCIKPAGVLSTDEPGGLPELLRAELGDPTANLRTVHRLDRTVGGLMVLARTARAASDLSAQIRGGGFQKEYLALCGGALPAAGVMEDLLCRDKTLRKTFVAKEPGPDVKAASLSYEVIGRTEEGNLVRIRLQTGRTHQIRAQFSARGCPLLGDKKYGAQDAWEHPALWSFQLRFLHPRTGDRLCFSALPPADGVWKQAADVFPAVFPAND